MALQRSPQRGRTHGVCDKQLTDTLAAVHVLLKDINSDTPGLVVGSQYVPVDTIICFRASIPLVIAVIEFVYMGRELPSPRSWAALFGAALTSSLGFSALMCMHTSLLAIQCPVLLFFRRACFWSGPLHADLQSVPCRASPHGL